MCCFIWTVFLCALSDGANPDSAIGAVESLPYEKWFSKETIKELAPIAEKRVRSLEEKDIGETGYVADTLYAALYSIYHAEDFETSIRTAVNLGYDTDTAGAVTGSAAGILYGIENIPKRWTENLRKRDYLESVARDFAGSLLTHPSADE